MAGDPIAPPRALAHRVDALVVAYRIELTDELAAELAERRTLAAELGRVEWQRGGRAWAFKRTRAPDRHYFEDGDARCIFDESAPGRTEQLPGWTLEITLRAVTLARAGLSACLRLCDEMAEAIAGGERHVHGSRLRRIDMAADFEGWEMRPDDSDRFVKHGRAQVVAFFPGQPPRDARDMRPDEDVRTFLRRTRKVTGFTVSAGNPIMARIYDKTEELRVHEDEHKRATEEALWKRGGWTGGPVTRVEFQLRGTVLDELCRDIGGLRDPSKLKGRLDQVWRYCHTRWLRMAVPNSATRLSRAKTDPRWAALQALTFFGEAPIAIRIRQRGGVNRQTTVGVVLSFLAGRDALAVPRPHDPETGEVLTPEQALETLSDEEIREGLSRSVRKVGQILTSELESELMASPRANYRRLAHQIAATRARFASILTRAG